MTVEGQVLTRRRRKIPIKGDPMKPGRTTGYIFADDSPGLPPLAELSDQTVIDPYTGLPVILSEKPPSRLEPLTFVDLSEQEAAAERTAKRRARRTHPEPLE